MFFVHYQSRVTNFHYVQQEKEDAEGEDDSAWQVQGALVKNDTSLSEEGEPEVFDASGEESGHESGGKLFWTTKTQTREGVFKK